ncbi:MAG TPA: MlaD family protein [Solirubrobacteraceae bacterium]|nr:MlaD family protein [Solirubrobacteraceae bacterium]
MRTTRRAAAALFDSPMLVGTMTLLVVIVAVYLSYVAEDGLPFVPSYRVNIDVPSAGQLVKNADVRIGGARVGQVLTITPEPATRRYPHPFARLGLSLERGLQPLAPDTHYRLRVASVLGGNYVEIIPGHSRAPGLPDGGTFTLSRDPRRSHAEPYVGLDSALAAFGPRTRAGLRGTLAGAADAVAGRGAQLNDAIGATAELLGPATRVLDNLGAPATELSGLVSGLAATTAALAPVAPALDTLLSAGASTFATLARPSLATTLDALPGTEAAGTRVLGRAAPVLAQTAALVQALRPAAALLPRAATRLDALVTAATPVFDQVPRLARALTGAAGGIEALDRDPAARQAFEVLGSSDLGTAGGSAFVGLGAILQTVAGAQFACNVAGIWTRNFASSLSEGNASGAWLRFSPLLDVSQSFAAATPAPDLHLNYYPVEDASQCQAGNEVYAGAQRIGPPARTARTVDNTSPPAGVLAAGRRVGLVP